MSTPPPSSTELRPHQAIAIEALRAAVRAGSKRPLLWLPTGAGKTRVAVEIIKGPLARGRRAAIVVPLVELIDQTVAALRREGIDDVGVIQADHPLDRPDAPIQVISAASLGRRPPPPVDIAVIDECHIRNRAAEEWAWKSSRLTFGLTATPFTSGLGDLFDCLVRPATMAGLTEQGLLVPARVYAPAAPDLAGIRARAGDFDAEELADRSNTTRLNGEIVANWKRLAAGLKTVAFCVDVRHTVAVAAAFVAAGIAAEHIDGAMSKTVRAARIARLRSGETTVLASVNTIATGFDFPALECIIQARPTQSETLHVQQIGRGLRPARGKAECVVLDLAGNHQRLGFAEDVAIAALCRGKPEIKRRASRQPITCTVCHAVRPSGAACPDCGTPAAAAHKVVEVKAELVEVRPISMKAQRQREREFFAGLLWIKASRGYREVWARVSFKERFGDWPTFRDVEPARPNEAVLKWFDAWMIEARRRVG